MLLTRELIIDLGLLFLGIKEVQIHAACVTGQMLCEGVREEINNKDDTHLDLLDIFHC